MADLKSYYCYQCVVWLLITNLFTGVFVSAQFERNNNSTPVTNTINQPVADTGRNTRKKNIKPIVTAWDVHSLLGRGEMIEDSVRLQLSGSVYWDEADTLPGFTQRLGMIGKPVQTYYGGLPLRYTFLQYPSVPFTGYPDPYGLNIPQQVVFLNTKVPYVNIRFTQASRDIQLLKVILSQNPTPFWNLTAQYQRRTAVGEYRNFVVDHYQLALTSTVYSFNRRWMWLAAAGFNQPADKLNGGSFIARSQDPQTGFRGLAQPLNAEQAGLYCRSRSGWTLARGKLLQVGNHALVAMFEGKYSEFFRKFTDNAPQLSTLQIRYPAYPFRWDSSPIQIRYQRHSGIGILIPAVTFLPVQGLAVETSFFEKEIKAAAVYQFKTDKWDWNLKAVNGLGNRTGYQSIAFNQQYYKQQITAQFYASPGEQHKIGITTDYQLESSNLFVPQQQFEVRVFWVRNRTAYSINDSAKLSDTATSWRPLRFTGDYWPGGWQFGYRKISLNPLFISVFSQSATLRGVSGLQNETVNQWNVRFDWQGGFRSSGGFMYRPRALQIQAIITTAKYLIQYDAFAQPVQWPDELTTTGIMLSGRQRVGRWYAEWQLGAQQRLDNARWGFGVPLLYGTLDIYYANRIINYRTELQAGVILDGFTRYEGWAFQGSEQIFYPAGNYQLPGYIRSDIYVSSRIKSAVIFLKLIHWNEGIWAAGYYTTPFYAMLPRTFSFGVNYSIFD